jgi:hypothetical protein
MHHIKDTIIECMKPISLYLFGVTMMNINQGLQTLSFTVSIIYVLIQLIKLVKDQKKTKP